MLLVQAAIHGDKKCFCILFCIKRSSRLGFQVNMLKSVASEASTWKDVMPALEVSSKILLNLPIMPSKPLKKTPKFYVTNLVQRTRLQEYQPFTNLILSCLELNFIKLENCLQNCMLSRKLGASASGSDAMFQRVKLDSSLILFCITRSKYIMKTDYAHIGETSAKSLYFQEMPVKAAQT
ncbi:hypothetical protein ACU8KH_05482 [Lachancea thermotolerans]